MSSVSSPQGFIRALKADSDPPFPGSQCKIDIARHVWDDTSFYIPSKSEIIAEWILTKFLKEKDKEISSNSIVDLHFWTLLRDVISVSNFKAGNTHTRRLKLWLLPLLGRIPFAPILCSWLGMLENIDVSLRISLSLIVHTCLEVVWPLAVQKLNSENLLECFSASIGAVCRCKDVDPSLAQIAAMVTQSYREAFANSTNKKKVCFTFMHSHVPQWLLCIHRFNSRESYNATIECVYQAGIDTVFNPETLRQGDGFKPGVSFIDSISAVVVANLELSAVLPQIFTSYIDAVKRHCGSKSANAEIRGYAIPFLTSYFSLLEATEQAVLTWTAKSALLSLVCQEDIFGYKDEEARKILSPIVDQALTVLEARTANLDLKFFAIESLSALCRIDYDFVLPILPSIVLKLLSSQLSNGPAEAFLDLILEYHIKTRTLDAHIETILSGLLPDKMFAAPDLREYYESSLLGPLFDNVRLGSLSKALQAFLTSSQVLTTPELVYRFLKGAIDKFDIAQSHEERSSNQRRTTEMGADSMEFSSTHWAVTFCLSAEIAIAVLSSLPISTATESTRRVVEHQLVDVRTFTLRIIKSHLKMLNKRRGDHAWALSAITAASFRLQYALDTSNHMPLPTFNDEKLSRRISKVIMDEVPVPKLLIELFRFLLKVAPQREQVASQAAFEQMLAYLEVEKPIRTENSLILLNMIIRRWLPVVESFALEEQLERLLRLILSLNVPADNTTMHLQPQSLLLQTLQSAQFLELPRTRLVLTRIFNQVTSEIDVSKTDISTISHLVATYRLLLVLPIEYFSRSDRSESIRQALKLDRYITTLDSHYESKYEYLTVIRTFLGHIILRVNTSDQPIETVCDTLNRLISFDENTSQDGLVLATLNLMSSLFSDLLKRSDSALDGTIVILRALAQIDIKSSAFGFRVFSITRMVNVLELNFKLTSFPQRIQVAMRKVYQTLSKSTESYIQAFNSSTVQQEMSPSNQEALLMLWQSLLSLRQWLAIVDQVTPVGRPLVSNIITRMSNDLATSDDKISAAALGVLLDEVSLYSVGDRVANLEFMLAAIVSLRGALKPSTRHRVDKHLAKICVRLSIPELSHVLGFISEAFRMRYSEHDRIPMLRISAILLHDHPQGAMKQMQAFITDCIHDFVGWDALIDGDVELRVQTLDFLAQICTEQPAVLRLGDMGGIWSLLARFLTQSRAHDDDTTVDIFHKITNIASAVVRLRRDLVVHTLPQLCNILRRLLLLLRTVRPNLGTRQTRLVTDTQPRWLNVKQALGVDEAKALARLLEALTIKNVVRNNAPGMDTQKAESLAKPLSKHAAYVLKAYIAAVNDPLCLLPLEHRKELRKGLYALCSMMSEHIRDAMMIGSLDAGGKVVMKTLWNEYEKQRYIGKG